jgi:hypothetical protein
MPVRRSPKYFHVSESGPRGSAEFAVVVERTNSTIMLTTHVVYDLRARGGARYAPAIDVPHACDQSVCHSIAGREKRHIRLAL